MYILFGMYCARWPLFQLTDPSLFELSNTRAQISTCETCQCQTTSFLSCCRLELVFDISSFCQTYMRQGDEWFHLSPHLRPSLKLCKHQKIRNKVMSNEWFPNWYCIYRCNGWWHFAQNKRGWSAHNTRQQNSADIVCSFIHAFVFCIVFICVADVRTYKYMICVRLKSAKIHCSNGILCGKLWFSVHHSINISANASETFMIGKQEAFIYHTRPTEDKPIAASNKCRTAISDCILEFNQNKSPLSRFQW